MLGLPPWGFAHRASNHETVVGSSNPGTVFITGASNADGTAVSVLSALSFDAELIVIGCAGMHSPGVDTNALVDILVDPAGGTSWASLIDDLVFGFSSDISSITGIMTRFYAFPLWIPSGSTIGVRGRTAASSNRTNSRVVIAAYGGPSRPDMWWCGQKVESLGINAASSKGTTVTPGSSGAYGSWTNVGATTGGRYGAVQLGINGSDNNMNANWSTWQIGVASGSLACTPVGFYWGDAATESLYQANQHFPFNCDIPEGTQLQVRGACQGTAEDYNVAIYGVY